MSDKVVYVFHNNTVTVNAKIRGKLETYTNKLPCGQWLPYIVRELDKRAPTSKEWNFDYDNWLIKREEDKNCYHLNQPEWFELLPEYIQFEIQQWKSKNEQ